METSSRVLGAENQDAQTSTADLACTRKGKGKSMEAHGTNKATRAPMFRGTRGLISRTTIFVCDDKQLEIRRVKQWFFGRRHEEKQLIRPRMCSLDEIQHLKSDGKYRRY
jgi:hypothetical protein